MAAYDPSSQSSILEYASNLVGMSFRQVLDLGISPDGASAAPVAREFDRRSYKGGMGTLLEERYFGYASNSESEADFADAGVELKATCFDTKRDGTIAAGERLVLSMIPNDQPVEAELAGSHLWHKCQSILLVHYGRDREIPKYEQRIRYVTLFTPPPEDLAVIEEDYRQIAALVRSGHAELLSEGATAYLGACTKGANRERSTQPQRYYAPDRLARRRAWCYKQPYMNYVLHHYVMGAARADSIGVAGRDLGAYCESVINAHAGESDAGLCLGLGIPYTGNKAQWSTIAYRLLGVRGDRADEFEKAGVVVRAVREEPDGRVRESVPLPTFRFRELAAEDSWEESSLRQYVQDTTYLFVAFRKRLDGTSALMGCTMWRMPDADADGPLREVWERARDCVRRGVRIERRGGTFTNDLPKATESPVAHVRPHSARSAYRVGGVDYGDVERDADELPDGRWMTRQSFWLNHDYVARILRDAGI
jgi:DNA mismatch repair endonuclease MutH